MVAFAADAATAHPLAPVRRFAGRWKRRLISFRDRLLHPGRRRRALRRLRNGPPPRHVLFLCLGNVCRSPYLEHRFRERLAARGLDGPTAESAGFIGPGRPPADLALDTARRRGVDTSAHRSQVVTEAMLERADLIVLVDAEHGRRLAREGFPRVASTVVLGDLDPELPDRRTIRDPWGETRVIFEGVFDRLDRCVEELLDLITR